MLAAGLLPLLSGCSKPNPSAGGVPPAPEVHVRKVTERPFPDRFEFTGHLAAVHQVEIRPRVSGYVINTPFTEGSTVRSGELLFEIDPRPFVAKHEEAKAEVSRAKAAAVLTQQEFERAKKLNQQEAIAHEELERRTADLQNATAALAAAQARQEAAALDLEFTKVKAPIAGRVGRALVKAGNLVSGGNSGATLLTTLVTVDPLHVFFHLDEAAYEQLKSARSAGKATWAEVRVGAEGKLVKGEIDYVSNTVDSKAGAAQARVVILNSTDELAPGLFARVTIYIDGGAPRLVIPETAIGAQQGSRFALVIDQENKIAFRKLSLGERRGEERLVVDGLQAGETIVINGLQRLRPGMTVQPVQPSMAKN